VNDGSDADVEASPTHLIGVTVKRPERKPAIPSARTPPWMRESNSGCRRELACTCAMRESLTPSTSTLETSLEAVILQSRL
jgi:hypothetical protein